MADITIPYGFAYRNLDDTTTPNVVYRGYNHLGVAASSESWAISATNSVTNQVRWAYNVAWNDRATANFYW